VTVRQAPLTAMLSPGLIPSTTCRAEMTSLVVDAEDTLPISSIIPVNMTLLT